ncbi:hypothetical protein BSLG_008877 [Batrachochytrium salamandrivorans]|nr:hypothetical protein BSLG_008877 [Batrachochytrium salamandrivorans]
MITAVCQSNAAAAAAATRHIATMTIRRTIVEPLMTRMPLHMKTAVCSASFVKSSFTPKAYARCLSISAMALDEIPAEKTSKAPSTSSGDSSRAKCVTTLNDAEIFSTVMRTWKISRHFLSRSDAAEIFRVLGLQVPTTLFCVCSAIAPFIDSALQKPK